ncbi:MAG: hypothetical protein ACRD00_06420 [Thermoanaerobaculia bacterium]
MPTRRIGEILIEQGVLTEAVINEALGHQRVSGGRVKIGTILLNWDLVAEEGLLQALARFHRVEAAPWSVLSAAPFEVARLIPPSAAVRLGAFPYAATKTSIHVAFLDPSNLVAADEIASITNRRIIPAVALEIRLLQAHQKFYGRHIPLEYRAIVERLERRTAKPKLPEWQKTVDFLVSDLTEAEQDAGPARPPPPPGIRTPPMDLGRAPAKHRQTPRAGARIPVSRGPAEPDLLPDTVPTIEIPEMPKLAPPPAPPPGRGSVADMWRPNAQPGGDEAASRMWMPSAAEIEASLGQVRSRDEIGHVALETFPVDIPRVLLVGCGKSAVTGWQGRGEGVTPEFIAGLRIPLSTDSVFATIQGCGVPHFGPLDQSQWPAELAQRLGEKAPDCAVFPIRILDGIAAFLYADRLGEPMRYKDFAVIARASAATANALTRFLLRRNTKAPVI